MFQVESVFAVNGEDDNHVLLFATMCVLICSFSTLM